MQHRASFKPPVALPNGLFGAVTSQKSRPLKLYRLATGTLACALLRALCDARFPEEAST
jgi:hypothetical protein